MLFALWAFTAVLIGTGLFVGWASSSAQPPNARSADRALQLPDATVPGGQVEAGPPVEAGPQGQVAGEAGRAARAAFRDSQTPIGLRLVSVLGLVVLLAIGWGLSTDRRAVPWRVIGWGLGLQLGFALLILKTRAGRATFDTLNTVIVQLLGFTNEGARFLFGNLVQNNVPVGAGVPGNTPVVAMPTTVANTGAYFAFSVLPTIIFFSSL